MTQTDIFPLSISKFATVCDLPLTAVKFLHKEGLIPTAGGGGGQGYKLQFDQKSLVYGCAIAALSKAGIGVKAAGRLLKAVSKDTRWLAYMILLHDMLNPDHFGDPRPSPTHDIIMELVDGRWIWVGRLTDFAGGSPLLLGAYDRLILERAKDVVLKTPESSDDRQQAADARLVFTSKLSVNMSAYCRFAAMRLAATHLM